MPSELEVGLEESRFRLDGAPVRVRPGGEINVRNALAAAAAARVLGVPGATIAAGLSVAEGPAGRLEVVPNHLGVTIAVDYAHTPDGLAEILQRRQRRVPSQGVARSSWSSAAVETATAQSGPLMGSVATRLADVAVLTSDNPRSEDPLAIIDEVRAGCDGSAQLVTEADRRAAIATALEMASSGDVVIVAGKGHESIQQIGDRAIEFEDRRVVLEELARLKDGGANT